MHGRAAVRAGKIGLLGERNGFGQDSVIVDDAAPAEGVAAQIDGDDDAGAKGAAHRYRDRIDERSVDQPPAVDLDRAEDARQGKGGSERMNQAAFVEPDFVPGAELGRDRDEFPVEPLDLELPQMVLEARAQALARDQARAAEIEVEKAEQPAAGE